MAPRAVEVRPGPSGVSAEERPGAWTQPLTSGQRRAPAAIGAVLLSMHGAGRRGGPPQDGAWSCGLAGAGGRPETRGAGAEGVRAPRSPTSSHPQPRPGRPRHFRMESLWLLTCPPHLCTPHLSTLPVHPSPVHLTCAPLTCPPHLSILPAHPSPVHPSPVHPSPVHPSPVHPSPVHPPLVSLCESLAAACVGFPEQEPRSILTPTPSGRGSEPAKSVGAGCSHPQPSPGARPTWSAPCFLGPAHLHTAPPWAAFLLSL